MCSRRTPWCTCALLSETVNGEAQICRARLCVGALVSHACVRLYTGTLYLCKSCHVSPDSYIFYKTYSCTSFHNVHMAMQDINKRLPLVSITFPFSPLHLSPISSLFSPARWVSCGHSVLFAPFLYATHFFAFHPSFFPCHLFPCFPLSHSVLSVALVSLALASPCLSRSRARSTDV